LPSYKPPRQPKGNRPPSRARARTREGIPIDEQRAEVARRAIAVAGAANPQRAILMAAAYATLAASGTREARESAIEAEAERLLEELRQRIGFTDDERQAAAEAFAPAKLKLRLHISEVAYEQHVEPLEAAGLVGGKLYVHAPGASGEWLRRRYAAWLEQATGHEIHALEDHRR
jgi:hypothetical protein